MSDAMLDRLPPQSREAEMGVIGSVLRDNQVINDLLNIIRPENFYFDAHQKIFHAVIDLYNDGKPVDLPILFETLKSRKQVEDVGGAAYLAELWDAAPTAANAEYYARIVRDKAVVRNLIHANTELLRDAYDGVMSADELLGMAERKVLEIAEQGTVGVTKTLEDAMHEAFDRIDAKARGDLTGTGIPSGFVDLDNLTAGLHNNELVIIAARPSVGKTAFALNLVRHVVVEEKLPAFFVSLEMAKVELAERLLCCQSRVDAHKVRKGQLNSDDIQKLIAAQDSLRGSARDGFVKLFIDDAPQQTMLRIAANARRLKLRHGLRLVVIDYLQLIEPESRKDPRQEQVAQISRRLKFLARELQIPVLALAQVNRGSEDRQDHTPRLSDLRESGCLTGDTLIPMADTGDRVPIRDLCGRSGFRVWALNEQTLKLEPAAVSAAFSTGRKPVYRLETRLGRVIRVTANHPFRGFGGWKRLDDLAVGEHIAVPRRGFAPLDASATMTTAQAALLGSLLGDGCTLPRHSIQYTTKDTDLAELVAANVRAVFGDRIAPRINPERGWYQVYLSATERLTHGVRNPVAEWLDVLGAFGFRSFEKFVPPAVFAQPNGTVATFLAHLWSTDGCVRPPSGSTRHPAVYYASSSERLARDVQELLLRFEINAVLRRRPQGAKGRDQFHLLVMGRDDLLTFAEQIGAVGVRKQTALRECVEHLAGRTANTNRDVIPRDVWNAVVRPAMTRNGVTMRAVQAGLGISFAGTTLYKANVSRARLGRVESAVGGEPALRALAGSDLYWDEVLSITPDGEDEVFDLTVPGPHNFVANGVVVHNSIEQDADTVMMLHRPARFDKSQEDNILEVHLAKQRNGPVGQITLTYLKQYMRYENYAADLGTTGY